MILVFSPQTSPRLKYILDFCFAEKGCAYQLISSATEWDEADGAKLNYSSLELDCDYAIEPSGLLFESDIDPLLKLEKIGKKLCLREDTDPFAVVFYLISRYEEYLDHQKDQHGRFTSDQSRQTALGVLNEPVADDIVKKLWLKLGLDYDEVRQKFECVPSFDIDVAWAYKYRPFWRTLGAFGKGKLLERMAVLLGTKKDPYDTYSKIAVISSEVERIICFAPVSDYAPKDKNISWKNENYRSLLRGLNSNGGMGLHPGYASYMNSDKLLEEKERLEEILGHEMAKSRFHFLRFQIPESYDLMIRLGFKRDYSMGYADNVGFRAGTSFPHYFFNLSTNLRSDYLVFPFVYMDSAFKDYLKYTPDEASAEIQLIMNKVKQVGGVFMCIWHNHSITDEGEWEGWLDVLQKTVKWSKES